MPLSFSLTFSQPCLESVFQYTPSLSCIFDLAQNEAQLYTSDDIHQLFFTVCSFFLSNSHIKVHLSDTEQNAVRQLIRDLRVQIKAKDKVDEHKNTSASLSIYALDDITQIKKVIHFFIYARNATIRYLKTIIDVQGTNEENTLASIHCIQNQLNFFTRFESILGSLRDNVALETEHSALLIAIQNDIRNVLDNISMGFYTQYFTADYNDLIRFFTKNIKIQQRWSTPDSPAKNTNITDVKMVAVLCTLHSTFAIPLYRAKYHAALGEDEQCHEYLTLQCKTQRKITKEKLQKRLKENASFIKNIISQREQFQKDLLINLPRKAYTKLLNSFILQSHTQYNCKAPLSKIEDSIIRAYGILESISEITIDSVSLMDTAIVSLQIGFNNHYLDSQVIIFYCKKIIGKIQSLIASQPGNLIARKINAYLITYIADIAAKGETIECNLLLASVETVLNHTALSTEPTTKLTAEPTDVLRDTPSTVPSSLKSNDNTASQPTEDTSHASETLIVQEINQYEAEIAALEQQLQVLKTEQELATTRHIAALEAVSQKQSQLAQSISSLETENLHISTELNNDIAQISALEDSVQKLKTNNTASEALFTQLKKTAIQSEKEKVELEKQLDKASITVSPILCDAGTLPQIQKAQSQSQKKLDTCREKIQHNKSLLETVLSTQTSVQTEIQQYTQKSNLALQNLDTKRVQLETQQQSLQRACSELQQKNTTDNQTIVQITQQGRQINEANTQLFNTKHEEVLRAFTQYQAQLISLQPLLGVCSPCVPPVPPFLLSPIVPLYAGQLPHFAASTPPIVVEHHKAHHANRSRVRKPGSGVN